MPDSFQNVTFVGDGAMATVLALLLESRGLNVTVWGPTAENVAEVIQTRENRRYLPGHRLPDSIRLTASDSSCFRNADLIVSAIPTQYVRSVWERLAPHLPEGESVPVVSVAKGIEKGTILRPTQIIGDVIEKVSRGQGAEGTSESADSSSQAPKPPSPQVPSLASLSGPSVADELAKCLPATVAAASEDTEFAARLQTTFTTQWFRVYTNPDLVGVELAGALKNVIALAAGILDGLQAGNNAKSALLSRGLAEITRLGVAMGATPETFFGLTGVGDLATTCFSPTGRNRTAGELLGKGKKLDQILEDIPGVVEGVPTTKAVVDLAQKHNVEMPITQAVNQVLFENLDPLDAISNLMSREPKTERVG
ncbi:NAD(P)H-dependent glycerol-3-phosphate dehydrogenase [Algisphaera agarilytica]|uniref:Glycerol-3-phosphate dehydrogenase [NAD(P)+] n=1 Tax=Algisphaera agarilytica TaxID=1385975 RepID=A0A7X0H4T5_9BACT|nr:NAD(P)H-dependent glycerol-3-phosphate dehydrogenase [Algisphaera agarilytica]MBB6429297.1 glycerol-3-phosphate dehydrogenase (NAD(P)+) [Algisphaera agarilytica]